jgi:hypothetical protein
VCLRDPLALQIKRFLAMLLSASITRKHAHFDPIIQHDLGLVTRTVALTLGRFVLDSHIVLAGTRRHRR